MARKPPGRSADCPADKLTDVGQALYGRNWVAPQHISLVEAARYYHEAASRALRELQEAAKEKLTAKQRDYYGLVEQELEHIAGVAALAVEVLEATDAADAQRKFLGTDVDLSAMEDAPAAELQRLNLSLGFTVGWNLGLLVSSAASLSGGFRSFVAYESEQARRQKIRDKRLKIAALSRAQWPIVQAYMRKRFKAGDSAKDAAVQASAHLKAGTLPGLSDTRINIAPKTLANLYSDRNK